MNSPGQGFQKLKHYAETDTQTDTQADATKILPRCVRGWYQSVMFRKKSM